MKKNAIKDLILKHMEASFYDFVGVKKIFVNLIIKKPNIGKPTK